MLASYPVTPRIIAKETAMPQARDFRTRPRITEEGGGVVVHTNLSRRIRATAEHLLLETAYVGEDRQTQVAASLAGFEAAAIGKALLGFPLDAVLIDAQMRLTGDGLPGSPAHTWTLPADAAPATPTGRAYALGAAVKAYTEITKDYGRLTEAAPEEDDDIDAVLRLARYIETGEV